VNKAEAEGVLDILDADKEVTYFASSEQLAATSARKMMFLFGGTAI
jgi:hypothetical protein